MSGLYKQAINEDEKYSFIKCYFWCSYKFCAVIKANFEVYMCSSPKPRTKVKGKSATSASFLSSMSAESRQRFTERANIAQERRDNIKLAEKAKISSDKNHLRTKKTSAKVKAPKRSSYWLLTISVKALFNLLFFRKTGASQ
tara:strand:+ start:72 stop:497 length:426 start_codon:yes stop_codon:yes gene_type:complete